ATGELVPAAGLQGIDDNWLSVNPSTGTNAISGIEQQELGTAGDQIVDAPDTQWGLLNQVCLFRAGSSLPNLYLLSGERGKDLGQNNRSPINPVFFGREEGLSNRQAQPRLLFYVPTP
ncbi:MAG: hypothetical protein VKM98_02150, partial [Cyanobacteriota bacterium]|nr:hypothetical protein [Cyanobacteriota bacterium]